MTSKELIAMLQNIDPKGVLQIHIWDRLEDEFRPVTHWAYGEDGSIYLCCDACEQELSHA